MTPRKAFFITLGSFILIVVFSVSGIVLGTSKLKSKSAELVELKLQDRLVEEQEIALIQANKDIEKYQELEAIAKAIVPQDKDQAKTVREIINIAELSKIKISSITFPDSSLGTKQAAPVPTTTDGAAGDATPKIQAPPITQVKPVSGINGLYQLEVTLAVDQITPTFNQMIDFLSRLEQNRRTAQVSTISINPGANRNLVEFNLTMNVFVKP